MDKAFFMPRIVAANLLVAMTSMYMYIWGLQAYYGTVGGYEEMVVGSGL